MCVITFTNIMVRPTAGSQLASGNITRSGTATITESPATSNYGTLNKGVANPTVTTNAATDLTGTGATLNGTVSSNGASTIVTFDYGQTSSYGSTVTATASPLEGNATAVSAAVSGLTCNTLYHFWVKGVNSAGTTNGADLTFTTAVCAAADFNAFETSVVSPGIVGNIFTKVAGSSFDLAVVAIRSSMQSRSVIVELLANTGTAGTGYDANRCPISNSILQTIASVQLVNGRATVSFTAVAGAYRDVRVRITNTSPAATSCSNDSFAIRPKQLTVTAPALSNATLTGDPKGVAGADFTLDAASGVASGYTGTPVLNTTQVQDHANVAIAASTLSGAFSAGNGTKASGAAFKYLDVGNIKLLADAVLDSDFTTIDQASGDCIAGSTSNTLTGGKYGCNIGSAASATMGRWYPSHYSFAGTLTSACGPGGMTYMDQDELGVALTLKAHASSGGTAAATDPVGSRYTTGYTNLAPVTISGDNGGTAVAVTRLSSPVFPTMPSTASWSAGLFQINDSYAFSKLVTGPDGAYDLFKLKAALTDPDGSTLIGLPAAQETNTTKIRYGRIQLQNAYGSEFLALPVPLTLQYWNGNWQKNTLDTCTSILPSQFAWSFPAGSPARPNNLAACESTAAVTGISPSYTVTLSAPGVNNAGWADLSLNLAAIAAGSTCTAVNAGTGYTALAGTANLPWLQYNWTGAVTNPKARATFGIYKSPLIYRRENY